MQKKKVLFWFLNGDVLQYVVSDEILIFINKIVRCWSMLKLYDIRLTGQVSISEYDTKGNHTEKMISYQIMDIV